MAVSWVIIVPVLSIEVDANSPAARPVADGLAGQTLTFPASSVSAVASIATPSVSAIRFFWIVARGETRTPRIVSALRSSPSSQPEFPESRPHRSKTPGMAARRR